MHNDFCGERHRGVKKPVNSTAAPICETATKTHAIKWTNVVKRSSCAKITCPEGNTSAYKIAKVEYLGFR